MRTPALGGLGLWAALSTIACSLPFPADVPSGDGGIDAPITSSDGPDANPRGTVRVTVLDEGGAVPASGTPVVFEDASGVVVANLRTGADGRAEAEMLPGGSATVIFQPTLIQYDLETVLGIKPGDDIIIAPVSDHTQVGTFTVTYPTYSGATYYRVFGPCGGKNAGTATTALLTLNRDCLQNPMTVSVAAYTAAGFKSYLEKNNVAFVDGGAAAIAGSWPALPTRSATFTNIPSEVTELAAFRFVPNLYAFDAGLATLGDGPPTAGTLTTSAPGPSSTSAVIEADLHQADSATRTIFQRTSGDLSTYNLDVGSYALPALERPTIDYAAGTVTTPASGVGTGDVFQVRAAYSRTTGSSTKYFTWRIVGAAPGTIALPRMPPAFSEISPQTGDLDGGSTSYWLDLDNVNGYDEARNHAFDLANVSGFTAMPAGTNLIRASRSP